MSEHDYSQHGEDGLCCHEEKEGDCEELAGTKERSTETGTYPSETRFPLDLRIDCTQPYPQGPIEAPHLLLYSFPFPFSPSTLRAL